MNRLTKVGLVLLVIGVLLVAGGGYGVRSAVRGRITFSQPSSGEYLSAKINSTKSTAIVISSPAPVGGLIPAHDADVVNSSNVGSYAIASNSSAAGSETYVGLKGNFYYVVFSSTPPTSKVTVARNLIATALSGLAVLAGIIVIIAGIVCAIVGFRRGRKTKARTMTDAEYYAKRTDGSTAGAQ